ncbi:heme/hemin ABC transporter substrate-binding protein [Neogemmobacter tilapiae]|uniref:Hemin ABC transporter substrate-binding protein n=1 Tax=Neogemmobacter tilapiae TaxID=875041 RepID=A0A918WNQ9_9RHOB|nr:ABC transporter substrate-binding protein [Gemmobacter tilapiae]GHC63361.1 hemin ABC transporter substrate-binding protein [Gemmobacter tilapiae]
MRGILLGLTLALASGQGALAERIISLGGTVTEIVVALGHEGDLVGRDMTSTYPESVRAVPDVGYYRQLAAEGVLSLTPDLILADADAGPPEVVAQLQAAGVKFVQTAPDEGIENIAAKITTIAAALGEEAKGAELVAKVTADLAAVQAEAAAVEGPRKRVVVILAVQGGKIMAAGQDTTGELMLALSGAENALQGFSGYKPVTDEAMLAAAPDVILMMDRGPETMSNADLFALPALKGSPAAADQAVIRMNGVKLLGFGPRTAEAARELLTAFYGG